MEKTISVSVLVALLSCCYLQFGAAVDTITPFTSINDSQVIISQTEVFRLGFFSLGNSSSNRYVGILYNQIPVTTVVWVANRNNPLKDFSGILEVSDDGNLVVLNGNNETLWSSNVTNIAAPNTTAQLLDTGNLVLRNDDGVHLWQSFEHPSNAFIETMNISTDIRKGQKVELKSWKSPVDPSDGNFSFGLERFNIPFPEWIIRNNNQLYFQGGPWNGNLFIGVISTNVIYINGFSVVANDGERMYSFTYDYSNNSMLAYLEFDSQGRIIERYWDAGKGVWENRLTILQNDCDVYGKCGAFGMCDSMKQPICSCFEGFEPKNVEEWGRGNWSSGCSRTTPLQRGRDNNNGSDDWFFKMEKMKVPAFPVWSSAIVFGDCEEQCLKNCSCVAYAYDGGIGCMFWSGDLFDVQNLSFSNRGFDLYIRRPLSELVQPPSERAPTPSGLEKKKGTSKVVVGTTVTAGVLISIVFALLLWRWMAKQRGRKQKHKQMKLQFNKGNESYSDKVGEKSVEVKLQELAITLQFRRICNFEELATATNNFHHANKLGHGGFGSVYKGILDDDKEIAVKRLSKASGQGLEEFVNEVVIISKLQHRNLVKLLGCCVEGEEKMLIYDYMPNKSLDAFLFDPVKQNVLDWTKRFNIIKGVNRGLLYLHKDSRMKIIHRDLKASNILLDQELNPKISDFGMARIFGDDENLGNTKRVVGTYGYMSPEYAMKGQFSEKSDVFSFGVLLLEIVSGRKNASFYNNHYHLNLLGYAWKLWSEDNIWGIVNKVISDSKSDSKYEKEIWRCIRVGLLCVQEYAKDRPTMSTVFSMLNSEILDLNTPKQPAFSQTPLTSQDIEDSSSINDITVSDFNGR